MQVDICTTIADWNPDLVFLTGDFTTIESYFEHEKLAYGFSPLKPLKGKLFACLGVCKQFFLNASYFLIYYYKEP